MRLTLFVGLMLMMVSATAAEFSVQPMTIEMKPRERSAVIMVRNHDSKPVHFQVEGYDRAKDADEKVVNTETQTLIYFPRQLTVQPGELRYIRVGVRTLLPREQVFTVVLRQVELEQRKDDEGMQVKVLMAVGIPMTVAGARTR